MGTLMEKFGPFFFLTWESIFVVSLQDKIK